jgi:hypothetical protein
MGAERISKVEKWLRKWLRENRDFSSMQQRVGESRAGFGKVRKMALPGGLPGGAAGG